MKNQIHIDPINQNKEAYEEQLAFIETMKKVMRLEDWDISLEYETANGSEESTIQHITIYENRPKAIIYANVENDEVNDRLEENTIHEMAHIWLDRLNEYVARICRDDTEKKTVRDMIEFATDNIARAIWNAMQYEKGGQHA